uniref:Branched-chain amino acid transporter n=1 Tax=Streptomyces sp. SANK 60404 TaxID=1213862 RepID=A0A1B4ZDC0_9ACTN|nr:branched-chain amino acid transporter [Streptomyces sp. SANK 60404]
MGLTLLIVGMALCAFATRWVPVVLFDDRELPAPVKLALDYVPGAVLAALVFPAVFTPLWTNGDSHWAVPTLLGGVATVIAGRLVKHFLASAAIGVAVFFLAGQLLG